MSVQRFAMAEGCAMELLAREPAIRQPIDQKLNARGRRWARFEFAKANRRYSRLKIPGRAGIEFFAGPHTINGVGTYKFLPGQLAWPEP